MDKVDTSKIAEVRREVLLIGYEESKVKTLYRAELTQR